MYFCRQPPPERSAPALRSLHYSLNTPVVAIENLAVGPARAAIAVQELEDGRTSLMLVVRSQRTGQLACFAHDETLESEGSTQITLDGALTFAESMGFLFDDDAIPELGADGPQAAARAWNDLLGLGSDEAPGGGEEALETDADAELDDELEIDSEPAASDAAAELWLEDLAPAAARADVQADAPLVLLTKFRRAASAGQAAQRHGSPIRRLSHV